LCAQKLLRNYLGSCLTSTRLALDTAPTTPNPADRDHDVVAVVLAPCRLCVRGGRLQNSRPKVWYCSPCQRVTMMARVAELVVSAEAFSLTAPIDVWRRSSAAGSPLEMADGIDDAALARVMRSVPLDAAVLAGSAVALLVAGYLLIYILVFIPRGSVG
jgi:hypothetical protein